MHGILGRWGIHKFKESVAIPFHCELEKKLGFPGLRVSKNSRNVAGIGELGGISDQARVIGIHASPWIVGRAWMGTMAVVVGIQLQVDMRINQIGSLGRQWRKPIGCLT
jgi:hypothetical protein